MKSFKEQTQNVNVLKLFSVVITAPVFSSFNKREKSFITLNSYFCEIHLLLLKFRRNAVVYSKYMSKLRQKSLTAWAPNFYKGKRYSFKL
jgi:hypothetical protein